MHHRNKEKKLFKAINYMAFKFEINADECTNDGIDKSGIENEIGG